MSNKNGRLIAKRLENADDMTSSEYALGLKKPKDDDDKIKTQTYKETIAYLKECCIDIDEYTDLYLHFFEKAGYDAEKGKEYLEKWKQLRVQGV